MRDRHKPTKPSAFYGTGACRWITSPACLRHPHIIRTVISLPPGDCSDGCDVSSRLAAGLVVVTVVVPDPASEQFDSVATDDDKLSLEAVIAASCCCCCCWLNESTILSTMSPITCIVGSTMKSMKPSVERKSSWYVTQWMLLLSVAWDWQAKINRWASNCSRTCCDFKRKP